MSDEFAAYTAALDRLIQLPVTHAVRVDAIEAQARSGIAQLDHRRKLGAQQWIDLRDRSSRLSRRISELAGQVGAPPAPDAVGEPYPGDSIPGALESLRKDVERAEQSWQWVIRHRERVRQQPPLPVLKPVHVAPQPARAPAPEPAKSGRIQTLLVVAGAVVAVLILVIIVIAV